MKWHDKVKDALLIRYQLKEDGFGQKYRLSEPEARKTFDQLYTRTDGYPDRWIELSEKEMSYQEMKEFMKKEQFLSICQQNLAIYLKQVAPCDHKKMRKYAEQYLSARVQQLA